jgi:hypothetical protein
MSFRNSGSTQLGWARIYAHSPFKPIEVESQAVVYEQVS